MTFVNRPKFYQGAVELAGAGSVAVNGSGRVTVLSGVARPDEQIVIDKWDSGLTSLWQYRSGQPVDWDGNVAE